MPNLSLVPRWLSPLRPDHGVPADNRSLPSGLPPADRRMLTAILALALSVRLLVVTNLNINWDEFFFLSLVHDFVRGDVELNLQTFHVHFFGWLPRVALNEVDQVVAARGVMLGFHALTVVLLYRLARRVVGPHAALVAAAAYLSVSLVIRNGTSFRSDTIALPFVMAAFNLLLSSRTSTWRPALAGLSIALAGMITIKTAIFLPAVAVILVAPLLEGWSARELVRRTGATALAGGVGFAVLYQLHALSAGSARAESSIAVAATSLSTTIAKTSFLPQRDTLVATLVWDMPFWALWLFGGSIVVHRIRGTSGRERAGWTEVAALALPVASIAVYRNSFPYFYATILAPASVLLAVGWQRFTERWAANRDRAGRLVVVVTFSWFAASLLVHGMYVPLTMPLQHQRRVLAVVHRAFPEPVPYLDRSSALASFPQVGFFMTTWGLHAYLERRQPVLREAVEQKGPPLLLANHPLLNPEHVVHPASSKDSLYLLPEDRAALVGAYVHHWGPVFVAGKHLEAGATGSAQFDLPIPGRYTVEARGPVSIDGRTVPPGGSIDLARGRHWADVAPAAEPATLRWGERLYRPAEAPPREEFFLGF